MMGNVLENTPIIIGVGQSVSHWQAEDGSEIAPSPIGMAAQAARQALDDTTSAVAITKTIDTLALVRTMADSLPATQYPLGAPVNAPGVLAYQLDIKPDALIYADVGGDTPQALVSEMAARIYTGKAKVALIAGGEATGAMKAAGRARLKLDWSAPSYEVYDTKFEDRGFGPDLLNDIEMRHGLAFPTQVYSLFEEAWRHRKGLSRTQHRAEMAELFAPFSKISADNPYAQFGKALNKVLSKEFLQTPSQKNYDISTPYLKWHVAQDAVNQGAAILMTSVGEAKRLGVPKHKWIFLHANAEVRDKFITERPDLSKSKSMQLVLNKMLADTNLTIKDIAHVDLYSCFPCAVFFAAEALGIDWRERPLTVTGGLPFFGAPGNNYSMHAIATLAECLRKDRDGYGLILANGGYLSKQAAGIYSAKPKYDWAPPSNVDLRKAIKNTISTPIDTRPKTAKVIAHTLSYYRGIPMSGFAICKTKQGRCLAKITAGEPEQLRRIAHQENLGTVSITTINNVNYLSLLD